MKEQAEAKQTKHNRTPTESPVCSPGWDPRGYKYGAHMIVNEVYLSHYIPAGNIYTI